MLSDSLVEGQASGSDSKEASQNLRGRELNRERRLMMVMHGAFIPRRPLSNRHMYWADSAVTRNAYAEVERYLLLRPGISCTSLQRSCVNVRRCPQPTKSRHAAPPGTRSQVGSLVYEAALAARRFFKNVDQRLALLQ